MKKGAVKDIHICAANAVEELVRETGIRNILSIEHPDAQEGKGRAPRIWGANQKILCFWDIEEENFMDGPSKENVVQGLEFLDQYADQGIIVHCKAGKARSVGMVLGWLASREGIEDSIEHIKNIRPEAAPNIEVIRLADEHYNMDYKMFGRVLADDEFSEKREIANLRREQQLEEFLRDNPEKAAALYIGREP